MARRNRRPVVGPQQLHVAQLSPALRRIYAHRSKAAARREYTPVLQADRAAFDVANQAYGTQAQSARAATSMVQDSLAQALRGLKGSGLSGKYLRQTQNEFTARQQDAASAIPALLADAGAERAQAFQKARSELLQDRAKMQGSAASKFNELLKEADKSASSYLKEQDNGPSGEAAKTASYKSVALAIREAKRLMAAYPNEKPETPEEWAKFTGLVAKAEEVGPDAAMRAIQILRNPRAFGNRILKGLHSSGR